jgi:polyphosphate kinase
VETARESGEQGAPELGEQPGDVEGESAAPPARGAGAGTATGRAGSSRRRVRRSHAVATAEEPAQAEVVDVGQAVADEDDPTANGHGSGRTVDDLDGHADGEAADEEPLSTGPVSRILLRPQAAGDEATDAPTVVEAFGTERFLNRELSWLDFAARLLDIAEDQNLPVLERVKFLGIFSTGLDEFFQVRVAGLKEQAEAKLRTLSPDGRSAPQQLTEIREKVISLLTREEEIFSRHVMPVLSESGVRILDWGDLDHAGRKELLGVFERDIFPVLTPLAVDPGHPFPYISNLSLNLAVLVADTLGGEPRFARVKVPPLLPRFVPLSDGDRFVPLEQVIAANLGMLFPEMRIGSYHPFRVIRNADLELEEDEADDLLAAVEVELRRRRFGRVVAIGVDATMPDDIRELLAEELEIGPDDIYEFGVPLDLGALMAVAGLDRPELQEPTWAPMTQPGLAAANDDPVDLFAALRERDFLVHLPYDSFATSVEAFIDQASLDPNVLAIKICLYRTSGDSPILSSLIEAANSGKQVVVLIELKARFDEKANIGWARALEQAGVHVVYGFVGLKTHAKVALVVRREEEGIRRYCHIGTGNYNSETARIYEDLGLLTASPYVGADLTDLFNSLTGYSRPTAHRSLVVAPYHFRPWVLDKIAKEAEQGNAGRITIKVNGLTDPEVIDALYRASQAGTRIELVVRGLCCLRPGVPGLSENISVRSIVGRFLEHSRIFRFGNVRSGLHGQGTFGASGAEYFIGSGDLMERNLDRRVEVLAPVTDPELCDRLEAVLALNLADDISAWTLDAEGHYQRALRRVGVSTQGRLQDLAKERARRRRTPDPVVAAGPAWQR